ncbi:MAG TPA: retroviral-like aspartic protease family protein [Candidatus Bathyarchaeia archaeon]|nr:retroviral-like aspartic protease family protein [Candidatus Bathyarchaeia archaeon]
MKINFSIENGQILIPVRINNTEKIYNFHFDIGAKKTTIFPEVIEELGISLQGCKTHKALTAGGEIEIPLVALDSLSVGLETINNLEVIVANMKKGNACMKAFGALGHDFLQNYKIHLNISKEALTLTKTNEESSKALSFFEYFNNTHLVSIEAKINDKESYWFILDTGATGNILNSTLANELNLLTKETEAIALSPSGPIHIRETILSKFEVESKTVSNMLFHVMNLDHLNRNGPRKIGGIIGYPFLKDIELIIDYPNQQFGLIAID